MQTVRISDWNVFEEQWDKGKKTFEAYKVMAADAKRLVYLEEKEILILGAYEYSVSLEHCRDMPDICRWIFHLQGKPWMKGRYVWSGNIDDEFSALTWEKG